MSTNSAIEWTDHTFNPWWGCTRVSAGCAHCYAETLGHRFGVEWGAGAARRPASEKVWDMPRNWNAAAKLAGRRARVFCSSMADVFDSAAPEHALSRLFDLIKVTPWLDWQLLTKRPENIRAALPADWGHGYRNVWLGVSVENQAAAAMRIPLLLQVQAAVRFLSCEPLLGRVDLCEYLGMWWNQTMQAFEGEGAVFNRRGIEGLTRPGIGWVIAGGESGRAARPMEPAWARSLRNQCEAAGVPFLFKQWGEWRPAEFADDWIRECEPENVHHHVTTEPPLIRVGKKAAGRLLDGREWNEYPVVQK